MITIAIPIFNAEKYLAKAVDSILQQTYSDWKLLLLDDGSTDSSLRIAKEYESKDDRIRVFADGRNKGLNFRLNQIPTLVDTEYLARMDSDDIMHPRKIEKQINILLEHPEINVLGTNTYSIDENDLVFGIRSETGKGELVEVNGFIHPTIMAKTSWFLENPYDENALRLEDTELWFRTNPTNKFYALSEPLFFYREFGSDYYKKYFLANLSKNYILFKHKNHPFWIKFFNDNRKKGIIYKLFSFISSEEFLIKRRNIIKFANKVPYEKFIK